MAPVYPSFVKNRCVLAGTPKALFHTIKKYHVFIAETLRDFGSCERISLCESSAFGLCRRELRAAGAAAGAALARAPACVREVEGAASLEERAALGAVDAHLQHEIWGQMWGRVWGGVWR